MKSTDKTIFTFWEPRGKIPHYLELCRWTWEVNLPGYEIITLDYSNIHDYVAEGVFDFSALRKLTLPIQKDAIMVAVLKSHGGVFMDIDTLVFRDIAPVLKKLNRSEVVMFDTHVSFVAAKAGARILSLWLEGIQERLSSVGKENDTVPHSWDFLGNGVLRDVMDEIYKDSAMGRLIDIRYLDQMNDHAERAMGRNARILNAFVRRWRSLYFRFYIKRTLNMLYRDAYGYIMEARYYRTKRLTAKEKYVKFWFEDDRNVEDVFVKKPIAIGLHHSWTPEWYKKLSSADILGHESLLSRVLNHIRE